jgi:hypothetical protein
MKHHNPLSASSKLEDAESLTAVSGGVRLLLDSVGLALLLSPSAAAAEEDNDGSEEQTHHRGQHQPHGNAVLGMETDICLVDVVLDDLGTC